MYVVALVVIIISNSTIFLENSSLLFNGYKKIYSNDTVVLLIDIVL